MTLITFTQELKKAGQQVMKKNQNKPPTLMIVILPENAAELYRAVKHDRNMPEPSFRVNVKMGGINAILDQRSAMILSDPRNPTVVMGADVIHPAPGSQDRPSFASLVANVDSDTAKYIADCRVQTARQEMIGSPDDEDPALQSMAKKMLEMYMSYRSMVEKQANKAPKRLIFYRDGVSEGQFAQVLTQELPQLQGRTSVTVLSRAVFSLPWYPAACRELNIRPNITIIVVGKRHHVRFFPRQGNEADKSGNCKAGTVVDQEITHPLELDFYLQSHAGLLGTSRPAHYNVLHDDNDFSADALQALSFALCHVYARSTRSVSIPAPVYYADIVCSRAKNHYAPDSNLNPDDTDTQTGAGSSQLERFRTQFKDLHPNMKKVMYFS
ncbi:hypothetical protein EIP86_004805 [Pleurotus ostreatoroseus]|nr:hypothetical protein EIP86_004805 [Pleurotus ostreatoroseus]